MRRTGLALLFLVTALLLFAATVTTRAHGVGTPQLLNEPAGPYLLSVWSDPDPLRADETHVVVAVLEPDSREPIVNGITVTVTMRSLDDPSVVVTEFATTDNTNRLLYAAEFNDRVTPGRWQVGVVASGDRGDGEASFDAVITAARGFNWLWVGIGGLALALGLWVVLSMRAAPTRRNPRT